jgi:hypothetical protein
MNPSQLLVHVFKNTLFETQKLYFLKFIDSLKTIKLLHFKFFLIDENFIFLLVGNLFLLWIMIICGIELLIACNLDGNPRSFNCFDDCLLYQFYKHEQLLCVGHLQRLSL